MKKKIRLWNPNTNMEIRLGTDIKSILNQLKIHWVDIINSPDEYEVNEVNNVHYILNKKYNNVDELMCDYKKYEMCDIIDDYIIDYHTNVKILKRGYDSRSY